MTDVAGTDLIAHTPDTDPGAPWARNNAGNAIIIDTSAVQAYCSAGALSPILYSAGTPLTPNYVVTAELTRLSNVQRTGIVARSNNADTYYALTWFSGVGEFFAEEVVASVVTRSAFLGGPFGAGSLEIAVDAVSARFTINNILAHTMLAPAIPGPGQPGLIHFAPAVGDATGLHYQTIRAEPL